MKFLLLSLTFTGLSIAAPSEVVDSNTDDEISSGANAAPQKNVTICQKFDEFFCISDEQSLSKLDMKCLYKKFELKEGSCPIRVDCEANIQDKINY